MRWVLNDFAQMQIRVQLFESDPLKGGIPHVKGMVNKKVPPIMSLHVILRKTVCSCCTVRHLDQSTSRAETNSHSLSHGCNLTWCPLPPPVPPSKVSTCVIQPILYAQQLDFNDISFKLFQTCHFYETMKMTINCSDISCFDRCYS